MNINIRTKLMLAALAAFAAFFAACSGTNGIARISTDADGRAIRGFDTVAYFTDQAPIPGDAKYSFVWNGAKWLFANADNLEKFKQSPENFVPQFGGYCSNSMSHGTMMDGDPQAWKIVGGKLYLNSNQKAKTEWEADQDNLIKRGDSNWAEVQKKKTEQNDQQR